jgi:hypothetical protein
VFTEDLDAAPRFASQGRKREAEALYVGTINAGCKTGAWLLVLMGGALPLVGMGALSPFADNATDGTRVFGWISLAVGLVLAAVAMWLRAKWGKGGA